VLDDDNGMPLVDQGVEGGIELADVVEVKTPLSVVTLG
jgi:hypothetical protein